MPSGKQSRRRRRDAATKPPPPVGKRQSLVASLSPRAWALVAVAALLVAAAVAAAVVLAGGGGEPKTIDQARLTGLMTQEGPWGPNADAVSYRLKEIGLPASAEEGTALHIHVHVDLFRNGKRLEVPNGIGLDPQGQFMADLHTHTGDGLIHVESPANRTFTLGELFAVWGLRLTPTCLGGFCDGVRVYVNGKRQPPPLSTIPLAARDQIAVVAGTPPKTIPSKYAWSQGE